MHPRLTGQLFAGMMIEVLEPSNRWIYEKNHHPISTDCVDRRIRSRAAVSQPRSRYEFCRLRLRSLSSNYRAGTGEITVRR